MWPPTPPAGFDLATSYGLHFSPGTQDEEGVEGVCICLQAYRDCADAVVALGRPLTFEEMREHWRGLPHWTIDIADMGLRTLGYHGSGAARYGRPTSLKEGSGSGDSDIAYLTDNQAVRLSGELPESAYRSGDTYSLNHEGNGTGEPT